MRINRYRQQEQPAPIPAETNQKAIPSQAPASFIRLNSPPVNISQADASLTTPSTVIPETTAIAIELPSGVVLRFPALIPISYLQEVVSLCSH